jgi:signal transduction histidine kinase
VLAILILIAYLALIAVIVAHQRSSLMSIVQELDRNQATLSVLQPAVNSLAHTLVSTQKILNSLDDPQARAAPIASQPLQRMHLEELNLALEQLRVAFPELDEDIARFRNATGAVFGHQSAEHLARMRDSAQVTLARLQDVMRTLQKDSGELAQRYHAKQQFLSIFAVSANVLGAVASVAVILVFFTRLTRDINRLQTRAAAIVGGYDGAPLRNSRSDEVGGLIDAVNRMQADLRDGERQQELTRQQRFHQEKMAAVGSIASAIGHEVRNPMAAISGVAQFIADESAADERPQSRQIEQFARQILVQTERISHILRQLATLTTPRSPEPELLNLNAMVRSTCGFIGYDKRFDGIEFEHDLDPVLPAVTAVSDHLMQILMNLLINAADAFDGVTARVDCVIRVATAVVGDEVHLTVTDNGRGMTPDVLAKAFEESFSTKPAGHGRGIGLFVCRGLIERLGGRIELASVPGEGTTATVRIPRTPPREPAS